MRKFYSADENKIFTLDDLKAEYEELKELDTQWQAYTFEDYLEWLLELKTIIEL